jgi:hypothetical protein
MLILMLTALLCSLSSGLDTNPKTRTVEYSGISGIPEDVAVGEIAFGESRLLYTYVNSSNIITVLAAGAVGIFSVAIFLYLYDLYITGSGKGYNRNDNVNEADFDYYDPYGYTSSFDPTTRIKKRYVKSPLVLTLRCLYYCKIKTHSTEQRFHILWLLCMTSYLQKEVCLLSLGADFKKLFFRTC